MAKRTIGVLVMSYGTPENLDQVEAYYTHIRRGHPPSPQQLKELKDRYEAIVGGVFPLRENTNNQVQSLQAQLNHDYPEFEFRCYQGLKHASPFIEDGITQMVQDSITEAIGIVLAPHYSVMSVGSYIKRAEEAAEPHPISMKFVNNYHLHPLLIETLATRLQAAIDQFSDVNKDEIRVLFSAHSLPEKILEMNDPYVDQLLETSRSIAEAVHVSNWQFAWQSAGRTATPWLGPDILDVLKSLSENEQVKHVIISPIGFVSDHLEVLYDIDIEAQQVAKGLGIHLERTASLNSDPLYMKVLADSIGSLVVGNVE